MLILISCLLLFATALALMIMRVNQSGARYAWLIAVTGAMLAFVSVFIWLAQMPFDLVLPAWQPRALFVSPILFRADGVSWPYALSISGLILTVLLTAVARSNNTNSFTWAGSLALGGLGLLAVTSGNPFTLLLVWSALDFTELITQLLSGNGASKNEKIIISFSTRAVGSFFLLWANIAGMTQTNSLDFQSLTPNSGLYLVIAAGLRLGVLPLHLPYPAKSIFRRGFGTSLRLVSAASSLVLLAHIPLASLSSALTPFLIMLSIIAGLYGSWMWFRAPDELAGRPYWLIGLAALSTISALSGNSLGAVAWGCALVVVGGALFLASVQQVWLNRILLIGAWSLSSLPFSLTASARVGSVVFFIPFVIVSQALLTAGFIRHALRPSGRDSLDSQETWAKRVYPAGILILIAIQLLLGLVGWDGARQIGSWVQAILVCVVTITIVWATPRFRILNPTPTEWENPITFDGSNIYKSLQAPIGTIERISQTIISSLEGDGGIMWTLLFLILFISLLSQGLP